MVQYLVHVMGFKQKQQSQQSLDKLVSKVSIPIAGGISGAVGWFISFPLDCVKSNIQGIPLNKMNTRYVYVN